MNDFIVECGVCCGRDSDDLKRFVPADPDVSVMRFAVPVCGSSTANRDPNSNEHIIDSKRNL